MHVLHICFVHPSYVSVFKKEGEVQAPQTFPVCTGKAGAARSRAAVLQAGDQASLQAFIFSIQTNQNQRKTLWNPVIVLFKRFICIKPPLKTKKDIFIPTYTAFPLTLQVHHTQVLGFSDSSGVLPHLL